MPTFNYEYFCAANVVLEVEGQPIHEAAGFSFSINESKTPLYGYSSRHWDAIARGQVIVQGSLIINYIHNDYLFHAIQEGRSFRSARPDPTGQPADIPLIGDVLVNDVATQNFLNQISIDPQENKDIIAGFEDTYWAPNSGINDVANQLFDGSISSSNTFNPHDYADSIDIKVTFGERSPFNAYSGITGFIISGVHFLGRGVPIQVDESVIIEEYSFLGRNVHTIKSDRLDYSAQLSSNSDDGSLEFSLSERTGPVDIVMPRRSPLPDINRLENSDEQARLDLALRNL